MKHLLPPQVLAAVTNRQQVSLVDCRSVPITGTSGAATGAIMRLSGTARCGADELSFRLICKKVRPVIAAQHVAWIHDPRHWAYWRREPMAYASGLLPVGPELAAPRCYAVVNDVIYLADVGATPESPRNAAYRLGVWQANTSIPDVPWLANHQLAQRIAAYRLNWLDVDADPGIVKLWERRMELLDALLQVPHLVTHGDFSIGNLLAATPATTVVLDWATFGTGPIGADLAHLALSTCEDLLTDYRLGLDKTLDPAAPEMGYRVTLALIGASRAHWMLSRGLPLPDGYQEFVLSNAP